MINDYYKGVAVLSVRDGLSIRSWKQYKIFKQLGGDGHVMVCHIHVLISHKRSIIAGFYLNIGCFTDTQLHRGVNSSGIHPFKVLFKWVLCFQRTLFAVALSYLNILSY